MDFSEMGFYKKMLHIENCRINALECISRGEPAQLADISDHVDTWGPWLRDAVMSLRHEALASRAMVDAMYLTGEEFMPLLDSYRKARAKSEGVGL